MELLIELEVISSQMLERNGNVHLGSVGSWMLTIDEHLENDSYSSYTVTYQSFREEAAEENFDFLHEMGLSRDTETSAKGKIPSDVKKAAQFLQQVIIHELEEESSLLEDFELSSLKNLGKFLPWEVHSFRLFLEEADMSRTADEIFEDSENNG